MFLVMIYVELSMKTTNSFGCQSKKIQNKLLTWVFTCYLFCCLKKKKSRSLPGVLPSLHFFRPSCFCELCPHDKTPPSLVRNKVCCSPQQMSVMTPGTVQDTGLRAGCGPNCPLELSPQQYICTMSPTGLNWWAHNLSVMVFRCCLHVLSEVSTSLSEIRIWTAHSASVAYCIGLFLRGKMCNRIT